MFILNQAPSILVPCKHWRLTAHSHEKYTVFYPTSYLFCTSIRDIFIKYANFAVYVDWLFCLVYSPCNTHTTLPFCACTDDLLFQTHGLMASVRYTATKHTSQHGHLTESSPLGPRTPWCHFLFNVTNLHHVQHCHSFSNYDVGVFLKCKRKNNYVFRIMF